MIEDPGHSQEKVVRPLVGNTQPGLPEEYATKPPRAADTPNLSNRKIKRLIPELPPTNGTDRSPSTLGPRPAALNRR